MSWWVIESTGSYKINIEVQKQFKAFCKAHSEYEAGDILANVMLEFMNKYKKVLWMSTCFFINTSSSSSLWGLENISPSYKV